MSQRVEGEAFAETLVQVTIMIPGNNLLCHTLQKIQCLSLSFYLKDFELGTIFDILDCLIHNLFWNKCV